MPFRASEDVTLIHFDLGQVSSESPLDERDFSVRASHILEKLNVWTYGELASCTEEDILKAKSSSRTVVKEIKRVLTKYKLSLRE